MKIELPILSAQGEADIKALASVLKNLADYWEGSDYDPSWDYSEEVYNIASVVYAAGWRPNHTDTHWANGVARLLTPEAYDRLSASNTA